MYEQCKDLAASDCKEPLLSDVIIEPWQWLCMIDKPGSQNQSGVSWPWFTKYLSTVDKKLLQSNLSMWVEHTNVMKNFVGEPLVFCNTWLCLLSNPTLQGLSHSFLEKWKPCHRGWRWTWTHSSSTAINMGFRGSIRECVYFLYVYSLGTFIIRQC